MGEVESSSSFLEAVLLGWQIEEMQSNFGKDQGSGARADGRLFVVDAIVAPCWTFATTMRCCCCFVGVPTEMST